MNVCFLNYFEGKICDTLALDYLPERVNEKKIEVWVSGLNKAELNKSGKNM